MIYIATEYDVCGIRIMKRTVRVYLDGGHCTHQTRYMEGIRLHNWKWKVNIGKRISEDGSTSNSLDYRLENIM
jgi:hypothetical protein